MLEQLQQILNSSPFLLYYNAIAAVKQKYGDPYRSWLGVNYGVNKLTFKFYFTFFEKITGPEALALLKEDYPAYLNKLNTIDPDIAFDFYQPGSGITFTIKFDALSGANAQGFFFRTKSIADITAFKNFISDFDIKNTTSAAFNTSPGYYFMRHENVVTEKTYAYITDNALKQQLAKHFPLANMAECVEVGLEGSTNKQIRMSGTKLILLGNYQNTVRQFLSQNYNAETEILCQRLEQLNCQPLCPGKYLADNIHSLYFFGPLQKHPVLLMPAIESIMAFYN